MSIFNSISRERNQNELSRRKYSQNNTQSTYFPQKQFTPTNIFDNTPEPTYPRQKRESNLSKMNSKIQERIEYSHYYNDKLRANQLRSSRISCSSNRSNRSKFSNKSLKDNKAAPSSYYLPKNTNQSLGIRSYIPPEQSKVRTFAPPQSHYNEEGVSRGNINYWKEQNLVTQYQNRYANNQFRYFTRNPVTIDANTYPTESRQPERDVNQSIQRSHHSNNSEYSDFVNTQNSKINTIQTEYPKHAAELQWNASFGSSMRNSRFTPSNEKPLAPLVAQANASEKNEKTPKTGAAQTLSPLNKSSRASKNGLIISAGLIALGVIILLLQLLK